MDAKSAIVKAKKEFNDLYSEEGVKNIGLEEVRYDDSSKQWLITLGFSWAWDFNSSVAALTGRAANLPRFYKVVKLNDSNEQLISITNRDAGPA